jgi:glycosyltransferase involved in cell wall biosynthesis
MYIVNPSQINFDFMKQRPQQLMTALSKKGFDAIFVSREVNLDGAVNYKEKTAKGENLWVVPETEDLTQYKPCILYVNYPPNIIFADLLNPDFIIFDTVDEPTGVFQFWNMNGEYFDALKRADLVLASAKTLYKTAQQYNDNVILVPNACEFDHFKESNEKPEYFKQLEGPIITYCGAIATWLDKELMFETAKKYPEYNFVFVGAAMNDFMGHTYGNIHILGHQPYEEIPNYLHHSDVLIIPFRENEPVVNSTHPVKLYEYFATGKPVVTTAMPETNIKGVYWSEGREKFMENIKVALNESDDEIKQYRINEASKNTWEARAEQILQKIEELQ